ncbi:dephospho kinase protein [Fusarium bulbicola]|nr:dephospho kinase protein [Fusarium bulbicola]
MTIPEAHSWRYPGNVQALCCYGQNNARNGGKRVVDTEILIREVQHNSRLSSRYQTAVARMNYLHSRYRQAGKILDEDLLHTLGSSVVEIYGIFKSEEWRPLSDVEKCAVGAVHMALGQDMEIPFRPLPSSSTGWKDGIHFATELRDWTLRYEENVALPTEANDRYVRVKIIGVELGDVMRESLGIESTGPVLSSALSGVKTLRRLALRHFSLPRPAFLASKALPETPNPDTGLYNLTHFSAEPWYTKPSWWTTYGPGAQIIRVLGGKLPESVSGKFKPEGYDLTTIGPQPQEGKGMDSMATTIRGLESHNLTTCPFKSFES